MNNFHGALRAIAFSIQPASYLEIGVAEGDSLMAVLECGSIKKIVLCDTWGGESGGTNRGNSSHVWKRLVSAGYDNKALAVEILDGRSQERLPRWIEDRLYWGVLQNIMSLRFDMILVDGDHSAEGAERDLDICIPLVRHGGGILCLDDVVHPDHPWLLGLWTRKLEGRHDFFTFKVRHDNGNEAGFAVRRQ